MGEDDILTTASSPSLMKRCVPVPLLLSLGLLAACSFRLPTPATSGTSSSAASASAAMQEAVSDLPPTRNVSYIGTIDSLDVSIYQQGTHALVLSDGQFILLESTDANLNLSAYLGKRVEVRGSVQPTIDGSGALMRVEEVTQLDARGSSSLSSVASMAPSSILTESSASVASSVGSSLAPRSSASAAPSITSSPTSSAPSVSPQPSSSSIASSPSDTNTGAQDSAIVTLAKQKYGDSALWTQQYCTSHIAFCVPAHKNWYFKSFGATTNNLWHVEFGMTQIDSLYQGPIVLNLVSELSSSMDAKDGQIKSQGSDVVGFRDWKENTHFEIIADTRLKDAVAYMLSHITPYTPGE